MTAASDAATPRDRVLLVEDEPGVRFALREFLAARGWDVAEAENAQTARERVRALRPDAVVLDYQLPDGDALALLPDMKSADPDLPCVVLTAFGSIDLAVRAVKAGAEQFLTKPVELSALHLLLARLVDARRIRRRQSAGARREERALPDPFVGSSAVIRALAEQARRVALGEGPVLLSGETGTGKGVLAGWLHRAGPRRDEPFVDVNCAGLSAEFLESELFGHERGAYTGAVVAKAGLLEVAHKGTVFLDEIGDVPAAVQPKILKVLEEKRFRRLGDVSDRSVDVRLIAATHHDLPAMLEQGRLRPDLYYRVSALPLRVPPLRERPEDIPVLAALFLSEQAARSGGSPLRLAPEAWAALGTYPWPGNVRELRNVIERAVLLASSEVLDAADLHFDNRRAAAPVPEDMTLRDVVRWQIERAMARESGSVDRAAKRLGIPRSSLYAKLKRFAAARPRA